MRLLTIENGSLTLTPDLQHPPGPYAILSHTWGSDGDEVTFDDISLPRTDKPGWRKIEYCLEQGRRDGYKYVWIDSCCINKANSSELNEAINLMYDFYANAAVCYVYLFDISHTFGRSRWLSRGWTLQEMVVPTDVRFYSKEWLFLGNKWTLGQDIFRLTGIDLSAPLEAVPLPKRLQWLEGRDTKKPEDMSYCLFGLLGVKPGSNYGEGGEAARNRLLREVKIKHGEDMEIDLRQAWPPQRTLSQPPTQPLRDMITSSGAFHDVSASVNHLLDSLRFPNMNARRELIDDPLPGTCTWLLEHESYKRWSAIGPDHFLWLKGNPGAGKSSLIKHADLEASHHGHFQISFYFNARGSEPLEQSIEGMYRSLLYQLLQMSPAAFDAVTKTLSAARQYGPSPWTLHLLVRALKAAVSALTGPLFCFIDALDECEDQRQVQDMVHVLHDLTHQRSKLYVFFASRLYPAVSVPASLEIRLDRQHTDDIRLYVGRRLDGNAPSRADLMSKIVNKANGIFMWAVLVVRILNQAIVHGDTPKLQKILSDLPVELHELLREIVCRDSDDIERFRLCLQLLLYGRSGMEEGMMFYAAMIAGLSELDPGLSISYMHFCEDNLPTDDMISTFVSTCSRGLAEHTDHGYVQFIHESVRDFLKLHGGLQLVHRHIEANIDSWIHDRIKRVCEYYINFEPFANINILADIIQDSGFHSGTFLRDPYNSIVLQHAEMEEHPFLAYVVDHTISHADQAARHISQNDFLVRYSSQHSTSLPLFDIDSADDEPADDEPADDEPADDEPADDEPADDFAFGHCLAWHGASRLIRAAHSLGLNCINPLGKESFSIAALRGNSSAMQALLDIGASLEATDSQGRTALWYACQNSENSGTLAPLRALLAFKPNLHVLDAQGRSILFKSSDYDIDSDLIPELVKLGIDLEVKDIHGETAIQSARWRTWTMIQLLQCGADLEARDNAGQTTLVRACYAHDPYETLEPATRILLLAGADVTASDNEGRSALMWARSFPLHPEKASLQKEILAFDLLRRRGLNWLAERESIDDKNMTLIENIANIPSGLRDGALRQCWQHSGQGDFRLSHYLGLEKVESLYRVYQLSLDEGR